MPIVSGLREVAVWVNDEKKRYYKVLEGFDLFGDYWLIKAWGGTDNKMGGFSQAKINPDDLVCKLQEIIKHRATRNYRLEKLIVQDV